MLVAINKVSRFWSHSSPEPALAVPIMQSTATAPIIELVSPVEGLEAFGSEKPEPVIVSPPVFQPQAVPAHVHRSPVNAEVQREARSETQKAPDARQFTGGVPAVLKWVAVAAISAGMAVAGMWQYQKRFAPAPSGSLSV